MQVHVRVHDVVDREQIRCVGACLIEAAYAVIGVAIDMLVNLLQNNRL